MHQQHASMNGTVLLLLAMLFMAPMRHSDAAFIRRLSDIVPSSTNIFNNNNNQWLAPNGGGGGGAGGGGVPQSRQLLLLVVPADAVQQGQGPKRHHFTNITAVGQDGVAPIRRPCYFSPIQCLLRTPGQHEVFEHHPSINPFHTDLSKSDQSESAVRGATDQQQQQKQRHLLLGPATMMDAKGLTTDGLNLAQPKMQQQPQEFGGRRQRLFNGYPWKKLGF